MPGVILGYDAAPRGSWAGYGTDGWVAQWTPTADQSLPAYISGVVFDNVRTPPSDVIFALSDPPRQMARPPAIGGVTSYVWLSIGSTNQWSATITAASAFAEYVLSVYLTNNTGGRTQRTRIYSADGATLYDDSTSSFTFDGVWLRMQITGSVKIDVTGTFPMVQGFLFDPVFRPPGLVGFGPARPGLVF